MKLVKKITVKNVLGKKPSAALLGDKDTFDVMTVYGMAQGVTHGTHDFGDGNVSEYDKFRGDFAAVRVSDGVEHRSGTMILPEVAGDLLSGVVKNLGDGADAVEFAFLITMKKADSSIGYEYIAEPLTESREHDPLATVKVRLMGAPGLPALEDKTESGTVTDIGTAKTEAETPEPEGEGVAVKGTAASAAKKKAAAKK